MVDNEWGWAHVDIHHHSPSIRLPASELKPTSSDPTGLVLSGFLAAIRISRTARQPDQPVRTPEQFYLLQEKGMGGAS
ncbi:hypothetical protein [Parafrankia sp. BMG5.11]|uniref:hypothetical protein n=1 Tax=Parafrankia sp. BMG5.11 TaxID=222540 RepID=UPI00103D2D61|nr:hypothetical protein [Parafrankia sp. BMG5.11]TCJ34295.1 hypothetical protein E0504_34160 [Parafrankia sp. BMG5.11]